MNERSKAEIRGARLAVSGFFAFTGFGYAMFASRIPDFVARFAMDERMLGLVLFITTLGAVFAFALAGRLADRLGANLTTKRFAIAFLMILVVIPLMPNLAVFAVGMFCLGGLMGATDVAMNTWAGEVEKALQKPAMSFFHAMFSLGAGLGALAGYVAIKLSWSPFWQFLIFGVSVAILVFYLARAAWVSTTSQNAEKTPLIALPKGSLLFVALMTFCASIGEGAIYDWSVIYAGRLEGVSRSNAALALSVFSFAMVLMRFSGNQIIARLGPVLTARLSGLFASIGGFIVVFIPSFVLVLFGFFLMGMGYALIVPLAFSRASAQSKTQAGAAIASVATLGYGGMLIGPPLIGFLAHAISLRFAFLVLAVLAVFVIPLASSLRKGD